jgi:hypothetical protein
MSSFKSRRKKSKNRSKRGYLGGSSFIVDYFHFAFGQVYAPFVREASYCEMPFNPKANNN